MVFYGQLIHVLQIMSPEAKLYHMGLNAIPAVHRCPPAASNAAIYSMQVSDSLRAYHDCQHSSRFESSHSDLNLEKNCASAQVLCTHVLRLYFIVCRHPVVSDYTVTH